MAQDPVATAVPPNQTEWWRAFDPFDSLYARILLIFGGGALAFTLLVCVVVGGLFKREIEKQAGPSLETLALQIGDKIDRAMADRYRDVQVIASLPAMGARDTPVAERRQLLDRFRDASQDYSWIGYADASGTVVAASERLLEGTVVDTRDWFNRTRTKPTSGSVHEWPALVAAMTPDGNEDKPRFVDVAAPVFDANGRLAGVVGAELTWAAARRAQVSVLPDTARRDHITATIYSSTGDAILDTGGSFWVIPPPMPDVPSQQRVHGSMNEEAPEGTYITGYARSRGYREFRGLNYFVTVRQPMARAFAPVYEMQHTIIGWGAGFAVVFIGVGWLFAWRLSRRLKAVGAAAERIGAGDILSVMPRFKNNDATAVMSVALGSMVTALRKQNEKLGAEKLRLEADLVKKGEPLTGSAPAPRAGKAAERPAKKLYI